MIASARTKAFLESQEGAEAFASKEAREYILALRAKLRAHGVKL